MLNENLLNREIINQHKNDKTLGITLNSWLNSWLDSWLGFWPLLSITWTLILYLREGRPDEILWICNVSNYLLGISLLLSWTPGIWTSTLWILIGTPLWFYDAMNFSKFEAHSFFTHLGSSAIGLFACRNHLVKQRFWWKAFLLSVVFQLIARTVTRPFYNVNGAFRPYDSQMPYWTYWILCSLAFALTLFTTEWLLNKLFRHPLRHFLWSKRFK